MIVQLFWCVEVPVSGFFIVAKGDLTVQAFGEARRKLSWMPSMRRPAMSLTKASSQPAKRAFTFILRPEYLRNVSMSGS